MAELSPFTRRRLAALADRALDEAGVAGILPTPIEEVQRAAGVVHREDLSQVSLPGALEGRLLGALWFERRTVYVDLAQSAPRRRFTDAHEAMHALCPWHREALRRDTEHELFRATRIAVEREANFGAALLLFQGDRFRARVAGEPCSLALAHELAAEHGTSLQATLRHHVEQSAGSAALLVTGRFPRKDGTLPVWSSSCSAAFARSHGGLAPLTVAGIPAAAPLREVVEAARAGGTAAAGRIPLPAITGTGPAFGVEVFYNRHAFLVLVGDAGTASAARGVRSRPLAAHGRAGGG